MIKVDLNCDLGESFGAYKIGMDDKVIPMISSCNIACGYHASDPMVMQKTVAMAKEAGIGIGAHPGYPDLMGFGRRNMNVSPKEAAAYVTYQLGALYAFAKAAGVKLQHVKPHGALYNMAGKDYKLALEIAEAVQDFDSSLILMGLAGSESVIAAQDIGLPVAREVFADRAYMPDGSLVPRSREGAVIHDEELAISRVIRSTYGSQVRVFQTEIPRSIRAAEISSEGKSIFTYDPKGKVADAYRTLTKEVLSNEKNRRKHQLEEL